MGPAPPEEGLHGVIGIVGHAEEEEGHGLVPPGSVEGGRLGAHEPGAWRLGIGTPHDEASSVGAGALCTRSDERSDSTSPVPGREPTRTRSGGNQSGSFAGTRMYRPVYTQRG
jgi:hypothetical protein